MTYLASIASSVNQLMRDNKKFIYLGEDVISGQKGISDGFYQRYGKNRVIDMPISESAFCGFAVGLAIAGFRPIVEFNFSGLIFVSLDQIYNQASKFKKMTGNIANIPIIYLLPTGTKGGLACHHSDNPYAILSHLGIKSYMPTDVDSVKNVFKKVKNLKEPVALFLPVEEFRNKMTNVSTNSFFGFKKLLESKPKNKNEISIICTGTVQNICINSLKTIDKFYSKKCSLYSLTDLSLEKKTINLISKIKSKKYLIIDDSPYEFGVASQIELVLRKLNPYNIIVENVTRKENFIPFARKLEDNTRPTEKKIQNKILYLAKID